MIKKIAIWSLIASAIGIAAGITSAIFLISLDLVTSINTHFPNIYFLLPVGGLVIGFIYFWAPEALSKGNNAILLAHDNKKSGIPVIMAPIVYLCTLITHLLGGSAGREGTAVQMSTSIAFQLLKLKLSIQLNRKTLIYMGVAAGFSGVFGTPMAGLCFAIELFPKRTFHWKSLIPTFISSIISHLTCVRLFHVEHTEYHIFSNFPISINGTISVVLAAILFGFTVRLFVVSANLFSKIGNYVVPLAWLRPVIAGIVLIVIYHNFPFSEFYGLGIVEIKKSFFIISRDSDFLVKLLLTTFTLSFGFKGGEVTPLFFIGATLGSALSIHLGLPIDLLTGIGFVCVFAGATHTPLAGICMSFELFGTTNTYYFIMGILMTHLFSGKNGIYSSQNGLFQHLKIEKISKWVVRE